MKILWLGPIVDTRAGVRTKAISSAADTWQREVIKGLVENGVDVITITYMPDQVWPKGRFWVMYPSDNKFAQEYKPISTGYLNLFLLRDIWIPVSLFIKILFSKHISDVTALFTYNIPARHRLLTILLRFFYPRIKWVSVIADVLAKGRPDITVFLSYSYYHQFPESNKRFFDGGVPKLNITDGTNQPADTKVLLYAGTISEWTGIEDFCILFDAVSAQLDIELHIYGQGASRTIELIAQRNKRIKFFGFVPEAELHEACKRAYAFVNPRPSGAYLGENNFPSKLLMYLSYGKPILSTKTANLSPEYDTILTYYEGAEGLVQELKVLISSLTEHSEKVDRIRRYAIDNTWKRKVQLLLESFNNTGTGQLIRK